MATRQGKIQHPSNNHNHTAKSCHEKRTRNQTQHPTYDDDNNRNAQNGSISQPNNHGNQKFATIKTTTETPPQMLSNKKKRARSKEQKSNKGHTTSTHHCSNRDESTVNDRFADAEEDDSSAGWNWNANLYNNKNHISSTTTTDDRFADADERTELSTDEKLVSNYVQSTVDDNSIDGTQNNSNSLVWNKDEKQPLPANTMLKDSSRALKKKKKNAQKHHESLLALARNAQFTGSVMVLDSQSSPFAAAADPISSSSSSSSAIPKTIRVITSSSLPSKTHLQENSSSLPKVRNNMKGDDKTSTQILIYTQPLLVLDLNGILCHRIRQHKEPPGILAYRPATFYIAQTPIIPRPPDLAEFLSFLDQHFCLAVWTSAKPKNAKKLVEALFPPNIAAKLLFVWGQNQCKVTTTTNTDTSCTITQDDEQEENHTRREVIFEKELDKVWKEFPLWNQFNTLLIDDSPDKCLSFRHNALHPPPLHGQQQRPTGLLSNTNDDDKNSETEWLSDEENHQIQMEFFAKLVEFWEVNHSVASWNEVGQLSCNQESEAIWKFLQENASDHMGWRS